MEKYSSPKVVIVQLQEQDIVTLSDNLGGDIDWEE